MASTRRIASRRSLVRTSAIAAVAGSALLLPAAAAFADSPAPTDPVGRTGEQDKKPDTGAKDNGAKDNGSKDNGAKDTGSKDQGDKSKDKDKDQDKKVERKLVRTQGLAGGFTAKVYKLGQDHFQADLYAKAPDTGKLTKYDTLETKGGKPAYGQHNGAHFVLRPDGTMKSWVEGGKKKDDGTKQDRAQQSREAPGAGQHKVVPKGGVKAGAEGVRSGDDTMLLAGGGAAAAAAGLGFTLLRRRKAGSNS